LFNRFSDDFGKYLATVDGLHLDDYEEMPLYIRPNRRISRSEAIEAMRDHYEGTPFDMTVDMTGGPWNSPYRPRPQEFEYDGKTYFHERPIATQQSACVMLAQIRPWLPDHLGGMLWFANDDANMVAYTPLYCCTAEAPHCYADPAASDVDFSWDSAFWVCNWVSNMVYPRYSIMYPELKALRDNLQAGYEQKAAALEAELLGVPSAAAAERLTAFGKDCAEDMLQNWKALGIKLVVMYNDMALKPQENGEFLRTPEGRGVSPQRNGYNEMYRAAISTVTGDRYLRK
ncbi:MAG: C69 family dipeptidase, partial [Bacteroidales bacterium]|nr:C69 family dipeptidase [Candidatus Cryptobacteroides equifaecalis]